MLTAPRLERIQRLIERRVQRPAILVGQIVTLIVNHQIEHGALWKSCPLVQNDTASNPGISIRILVRLVIGAGTEIEHGPRHPYADHGPMTDQARRTQDQGTGGDAQNHAY